MSYDFTAQLEEDLDSVSRGEKDWKQLMSKFWYPFKDLLEEVNQNLSRADVMEARELGIDPKSNKPISVRFGRFGPFIQVGSRDDEEKPRFISLPPGKKKEKVTLEEALELIALPRQLGETQDGEAVETNFGRYGPYVKYGTKYVSLPADETPYTATLERALELIAEKKQQEANKIIQDFDDAGIQVLNGRYGPYVSDGKKNARIPKDVAPEGLSLEQCQELLAKAKASPRKKGATRKKTSRKRTAAKS